MHCIRPTDKMLNSKWYFEMSIYEVYFEDTLKVQNNGNTLHSMVHVCIYTHTHADINIYIYKCVYIYIL